MERKIPFISVILLAILFLGVPPFPGYGAEERIPKLGPVKINAHPASLEGKTVLLRWNGKYNGDKFLSFVDELLMKQVKSVKIIKMWEVDSGTAVVSRKMGVSEELTLKIDKLKPDIVIAAQGD